MMLVQESAAATAAPSYPLVVVNNPPDTAPAEQEADPRPDAADTTCAAVTSDLLARIAAEPLPQHSTFKLGTIRHFFYSPMNVRGDDEENDVSDLLPLIASSGLLHNLIGYDEVRDGAPTGRVGVIGGRRRYKCLEILTGTSDTTDDYAEAFFGLFPDDYSIPYLLVSEREAIAISLAENSARKNMHPAVVARSMLAMFASGAAVEELAVSFGIDTKLVRQYLKMANLAPRLFTMYRRNELSFEAVRALCLTDDHGKQLSVIETLGARAVDWRIREMLSETQLVASHPLVKYVTLKAYTAAGGQVDIDLFSKDETSYLTDIPLLHKLALVKLEKKASRVRKDGHAWVDVRVQFTEADKSEFAAVRGQLASDEALAGAVVTIDRHGQATVVPGLIRSQDKPKMARLEKAGPGASGDAPAKPEHSDRLTAVLTSHRTAALQAELMLRPDVALALATYSLMRPMLLEITDYFGTGNACKIAPTSPHLADEVEGSKAATAIAARRAEMAALLPVDADGYKLFAWLLAQPQQTVLDLLAFCTAMACDLTLSRDGGSDAHFAPLAQAVGLNMGNWWTPTAQSYFGHVSKPRMMTVVQEAVSLERSVPLEKMKKAEAAEAAALAVAGTGWLPELLRAD